MDNLRSPYRIPRCPGHRALRKGRWSEPARLYLLSMVTHNREAFFMDILAGRLVVSEMRRLDHEGCAISHAWVIMPDHLHWLVGLTEKKDLSGVAKLLKGRSALKINAHLMRKGPVWSRSFHDHAVRKDEDVIHIAQYIIHNPIRAGLVYDIGSYPLWDASWL